MVGGVFFAPQSTDISLAQTVVFQLGVVAAVPAEEEVAAGAAGVAALAVAIDA
jgi:hypothetical protein